MEKFKQLLWIAHKSFLQNSDGKRQKLRRIKNTELIS